MPRNMLPPFGNQPQMGAQGPQGMMGGPGMMGGQQMAGGPGMMGGPGPMGGPGMFGGPMAGPQTFGPVNTLPPIVSPTQQFVQTNHMTSIVPHIHPSHTTIVNKHKFIHEHYCPHTQSVVNEVCHQHVNCGCPMC